MDAESKVISAMRDFALKYRATGEYKKYKRYMKFIERFEEPYFG